jgi:transcriptional regulator with GAF, ATPase, and Fis domain
MESENVNYSLPLDSLFHLFLNQALSKIVEAPSGSFMVVNWTDETLHIKARLGLPRPDRTSEPIFALNDQTIASHVVRTKKSYIYSNLKDNKFKQSRTRTENIKSLLSVPIICKEKVYGVINADSGEEKTFDESHKIKLEKFANTINPAIKSRD